MQETPGESPESLGLFRAITGSQPRLGLHDAFDSSQRIAFTWARLIQRDFSTNISKKQPLEAAMKTTRLLAAITASGAMLCLNLAADARGPDPSQTRGEPETTPLALRVEQLKEKLRSSAPALEPGAAGEQIDNIVQFFNFLNCSRGEWKNC
jgi:hypothetical protein